ELKAALERQRTGVFSIELLAQEFDTFNKFDIPDRHQDFMVFFEPPAIDSRIVNQGALFSFLSRLDLDLDQWLAHIANHGGGRGAPVCKRVTVAKELKWEVRDKLDHANVQERVLFPGLDGLCDWLKRWYAPKQKLNRPTVI
ncbi:MAG TPA: FRG domain-containing protein, partial [Pirellulaceae bacterium]|nr:FRG domain-containing protein [Pirellulaceae bacterium]